MSWNPEVYNKFKAERSAPFNDLVTLIQPNNVRKAVDLGCGTGELTGRLAARMPDATILGVDSSPEMISEAASFGNQQLHFEKKAICDQLDENEKWDLIFSHAALQWINNHHTLIPKLVKRLEKNGQLAIQVPSNHLHFTHVALQELALEDPFRSVLKGWVRTSPVLSIEAYSQLLYENGGQNIIVFEKVYPMVLGDADNVFEWISGTTILPYLDNLPAGMHEVFKDTYRERLRKKFPNAPVFYAFKRTIIYAVFP